MHKKQDVLVLRRRDVNGPETGDHGAAQFGIGIMGDDDETSGSQSGGEVFDVLRIGGLTDLADTPHFLLGRNADDAAESGEEEAVPFAQAKHLRARHEATPRDQHGGVR